MRASIYLFAIILGVIVVNIDFALAVPIIHMQDTTSSFGYSTHSGRQINAEYVSPTSSLVGEQIDTIVLNMKKGGSPTGTAEIGVFNSDLSVKKLFGTMDATTLTTTYTDYAFALPPGQSYQIQSGDRIGLKFAGGSSVNYIAAMTDQSSSDPFDGINSYHTYYSGGWTDFVNADLYMILEENSVTSSSDTTPPTTTANPIGGTYSSTQLVTLVANEPATIYYTTDGSTPTTSSSIYSTPISIDSSKTLKFFAKDLAGNSESVKTQIYTISTTGQIVHMQDSTKSYGLSVYPSRQLHAEYVSPTSSLVGKQIDTIVLNLEKRGSPTGTAQIGVFNSDLSVKKLFSTKDVSTISTSARDYSFSLPITEPQYQIQSGDRIGIKFNGGSSSNYIVIMTDQSSSDPFDGTRTFYTYYTSYWNDFPSDDLYMILEVANHVPPVITRNGANPVTVSFGSTYVDAGATAFDIPEGDLTSSIVKVNPVNTSILGTYTVTYDVTDSAGNAATQVTRTVNVADITAPSISITAPPQNVLITGPSSGVTVKVNGTASDAVSGIDLVEVTTGSTYQAATPVIPNNWSTWTKSITFTQEGSYTITARATDNSGNQKWSSISVIIKFNSSGVLDKWGLTKINPTKTGAREWFSNWDNGIPRTIQSGDRDPYNSEFRARGDGKTTIDGNGVATMSGASPRMYVYDAAKIKKWTNVEITFYGKRVSESQYLSYQGFTSGGRSEHQDASIDECKGRTYYGRMLYNGEVNLNKEVIHHGAYSSSLPSENNMGGWNTPDGKLPKNVWIGYKFVIRTVDSGQHVKMELYRDMTDGANGGIWQKMVEYVDIGVWSQTDSGVDVLAICGYPASKILLDPGTTVFIRNDGITSAQYKKWSIREVDPLP